MRTLNETDSTQMIRETKSLKDALKLAEIVLGSDNPVGEIVGPAGSGKTLAGRAIAAKYKAARVACWEGMSRHQLLGQVAAALEVAGPGQVDRLLSTHFETRRLVVVDEANKLNWRGLEALRYLADECGVAVMLIGTELYDRQFTSARTRELLVQLGSRIGAKRAATRHLDRAETYVHVFRPTFGDSADKDLITAFWQGCRKGNFREAMELAAECRRVMTANGMQTLTAAVLDVANAWMANRREVAA